MKTQMMGLALAATALVALAGCANGSAQDKAAGTPGASATAGGVGSQGDAPADTEPIVTPKTATPSSKSSHTGTATQPSGPQIVYFKVAQKPKCAEGTAVFRAPAVPLIIKWKISHATSGALSVDDPTHTPGTYGTVGLEGSQEFMFSCGGEVGSTETHTYAIYTVGGGSQRSKTLSVSANVLDTGKTP
jgi:hypothetical protein